MSPPIGNPARVAPWWFDERFEAPDFGPVPGTLLPCGCYLRRVDFEAVLCDADLAELNGSG